MANGSLRTRRKNMDGSKSNRSKRNKKRGTNTKRRGGLRSILSGNKSITSEDGMYVHQGTQSVLKCFECDGKTWKVNSFAFGGRVADAFDVDWMTDKTYYAYTCENCSEVRFKKNALNRGDRSLSSLKTKTV